MPLQIYNGKLLTVGGKLATDPACCCNQDQVDCAACLTGKASKFYSIELAGMPAGCGLASQVYVVESLGGSVCEWLIPYVLVMQLTASNIRIYGTGGPAWSLDNPDFPDLWDCLNFNALPIPISADPAYQWCVNWGDCVGATCTLTSV